MKDAVQAGSGGGTGQKGTISRWPSPEACPQPSRELDTVLGVKDHGYPRSGSPAGSGNPPPGLLYPKTGPPLRYEDPAVSRRHHLLHDIGHVPRARNCPFLMFTHPRLPAISMTKSFCRRGRPGSATTSSTPAAGRSPRTGGRGQDGASRRSSGLPSRMRRPSDRPGPRKEARRSVRLVIGGLEDERTPSSPARSRRNRAMSFVLPSSSITQGPAIRTKGDPPPNRIPLTSTGFMPLFLQYASGTCPGSRSLFGGSAIPAFFPAGECESPGPFGPPELRSG